MSDDTRPSDAICGVCCTASGCQYHSRSDCCCANEITVGSEAAVRSGETYCKTFIPREKQL